MTPLPGASPRLRPYDDTDAAAHPARHRPADLTSPLPRAPPSSAPPVSTAAASLLPCAAGNADDPSVASPRVFPLPIRSLCRFLCRSPTRRRLSPLPPSPHRCCVVPRAQDAGAPCTARPRCGPGKPGPACVRVHPCRATRLCPQPRHAPPQPCRARRTRDMATTSRSRRGQAFGAFPRAPFGCPHTHTPWHTRTRGHVGPSRTGSGGHTRSGE
jgi:hypothetical protein